MLRKHQAPTPKRVDRGNRLPKLALHHIGHWLLMCLVLGVFVTNASAQILQRSLPDVRPGDERQEIPDFETSEDSNFGSILPPYPVPTAGSIDNLHSEDQVPVKRIVIEGNTVLPDSVLSAIAQNYVGRNLSPSSLGTLRDRLTLAYLDRGYATSGASFPEQSLRDGILRVQIVEGRLGDIFIEVVGRTKPSYFKKRLMRSQSKILNVRSLQRQLEIFKRSPQVETIKASLGPTPVLGVASLHVVVHETPAYNVSAAFDNYRSPSIGSLAGTASARADNLAGYGDTYFASYTGSSGLNQFDAFIRVPITILDTSLATRYQYNQGDVVDSNLLALGISSESQSISFELRQPLYRSSKATVVAGAIGQWSKAQSFLGNGALPFPTEFSPNGISQISALRLSLETTYRTKNHSIAFRSLFSWGIDALGATINPSGIADSQFFAWLGQFQSASRLPWLDAVLLGRLDTQLSADPLLPLEQFAVGGRYTVRGYRQNALVRDNGVNASLEVRIPVYRNSKYDFRIELAPFADFGSSWNNARSSPASSTKTETIGSLGLGARAVSGDWGFAEIYWGHPFDDVRVLGDSDLQDDGIQFRVSLNWP